MFAVSVADSGSGIAPEVAERLFHLFATTKQHGTGVELSISRTIIEAHGGKIYAESKPDAGAAFYFTLPIVEQAAFSYATIAIGP